MKSGAWFIMLLLLGLMVQISSCDIVEEEEPVVNRYSFWKGDIDNFYYILDINNQKLHLVKGKPFMVLEYDPVNNTPLRCEFGLSEANNQYLPGVEGAIPEPLLNANTLPYANRLGLIGSVALLSNWNTVNTNQSLSAGGFEFTIDKGSDMWGHEKLYFSFTFDSMTGEIQNETVVWGGRVSDVKAFKMLRKFNSNTIND